jgi:hypothetical protein
MAKLGEGERQVRLGQDWLAIKQKRAESIYNVLPTPFSLLLLKLVKYHRNRAHSS